MGNRNTTIASIIRNSEQTFKHFDGLGGEEEQFVSADGGRDQGVTINSNVKPMVVDISNSDESFELAAPLFSAFDKIPVPFNGVKCQFTGNTARAGRGIVLSPQDYTLDSFRSQALNGAYILKGVRYVHGDAAQLQKAWGLYYKDGSKECNDKFRPGLYKNLANQVSDTIDSEEFFMAVDAKATLFIPVLKAPSASVERTIQVTFRIASETNMLNLLKGKSILELNHKYGK